MCKSPFSFSFFLFSGVLKITKLEYYLQEESSIVPLLHWFNAYDCLTDRCRGPFFTLPPEIVEWAFLGGGVYLCVLIPHIKPLKWTNTESAEPNLKIFSRPVLCSPWIEPSHFPNERKRPKSWEKIICPSNRGSTWFLSGNSYSMWEAGILLILLLDLFFWKQ